MPARQGSVVQGAAAIRRAQVTGKHGIGALMSNKAAFGVAVFASYVLFPGQPSRM